MRTRRPILVVTGETSGEQHAAGLIDEVNRQCPDLLVDWFGSGGERMSKAGVDLLADVSRLAAIGPWDALFLLSDYIKLYRRILRETRSRKPAVAILVDFPEFNLKLARRLKKMGVSVCYFIGPQIWAWRSSRVRQISRYVDLMLVVLPFEEDFYERRQVRARYVGNPSVSRLDRTRSKGAAPRRTQTGQPFLVALFPGSRSQEVKRILPIQLDAASHILGHCRVRFWVAQAPGVSSQQLLKVYDCWRRRTNTSLPLEVREEESSRLLPEVDCAIIKSGTSTLEATLFQIPFAMVYLMSWPSWFLLKPFVRTQTYCLANLIAGKTIVPEFVQGQATGENIGDYVIQLLLDEKKRETVREQLKVAADRLGRQDAYQEAAKCLRESFLETQG